MATQQTTATRQVNIRDINPLEHITSDLAKARFNYESMLNGLVEWNSSKLSSVTVRLMCDTEPGFVDYTFPTKRATTGNGGNSADPYSWNGSYSFQQRSQISAMVSDSSLTSDRIDIRVTVNEAAGSTWKVCASAVLYDEHLETSMMSADDSTEIIHVSESDGSEGNIVVDDDVDADSDHVRGQFVRIWYPETAYCSIRWVSHDLSRGDTMMSSNCTPVFTRWTLGRVGEYGATGAADRMFAVYAGKVYRPTGTIGRSVPSAPDSGWEYYCDVFSSDIRLEHGKVYLYDPDAADTEYLHAELFVYTGEDTAYPYPPYEISVSEGGRPERTYNGGWHDSSVILLPFTPDFDSTGAFRWTVTTDVDALVLLRTSDGSGDGLPDIELMPTLHVSGGTTEDNGGMAILDTANYSSWPGTTPKWSAGHTYCTDTSRGAGVRQDYTATMIFDHANPACKECNIVNYDGPDLDQGLAIYLPVESTVDGAVVYPKNGRTFEFLFRIWPNPAYNGHETADLIINKAQIYVYSVESASAIDSGAAPIAKFSMARLTNFYVFSENIAVPNRPVLVKARFVYSAEDREWKTYDYYQLPDCIFLSPNGFVDPSRPSDETGGVETAGFPLVQDPFSGYDLSPVLVDDEYRNRIG
jgi:hypothetical protein